MEEAEIEFKDSRIYKKTKKWRSAFVASIFVIITGFVTVTISAAIVTVAVSEFDFKGDLFTFHMTLLVLTFTALIFMILTGIGLLISGRKLSEEESKKLMKIF